jgi:hypothetical protein
MQGRSNASSGVEGQTSTPSFILPPVAGEQQELAPFLNLSDELVKVNHINAPDYMAKFMKAKDIASTLYAQSVYEHDVARRERKKAWSIAKLDRASNILKMKGLKVTESATSAYADMDAEYLQACEMESYWRAKEEYFKNKLFSFQDAHKDVRSIYEKEKEPVGSRSALPSGDTP